MFWRSVVHSGVFVVVDLSEMFRSGWEIFDWAFAWSLYRENQSALGVGVGVACVVGDS